MSNPLRCMKYNINSRIITFVVILAIVATVYASWPSDYRNVDVMRVELGHVRVHTGLRPAIDVSLNATVEVENMVTMYTLDYTSVDVAVVYRGKELGHVIDRGGGHVTESGSSYVDAIVEIEEAEVEFDWIVDDYAKGLIQFEIIAQLDGFIPLLFDIPLKAKHWCKIDVDIENQTIIHQVCDPMEIEIGFSISFPIPFTPLQVQIKIDLRF